MPPAGEKNYLTDWVQIENLSQELLTLSSEERWNELQNLADDRNRLLSKFFTKDVPAEYAQDIADGIKRVNELDEQVAKLAEESKEKIRQDLISMSKIKSVQKAYNDNN